MSQGVRLNRKAERGRIDGLRRDLHPLGANPIA